MTRDELKNEAKTSPNNEPQLDASLKLDASSKLDAGLKDDKSLRIGSSHGKDTEADEKTGYAIAHFLASHPQLQRAAFIMVHSYNPEGAMRMVEALRNAGRQAEYVPFNYLDDRIKSLWQR